MTDKIKDSTKRDTSITKPVGALAVGRVVQKPLVQRSLTTKPGKHPIERPAASAAGVTGSMSNATVKGVAAATSSSKHHEKNSSGDVNPTAIRNINALANHRKEVPYNELKLFEKISVVHSVMTKMNADMRFEDSGGAISVMKEHLFLMLELERLAHVKN